MSSPSLGNTPDPIQDFCYILLHQFSPAEQIASCGTWSVPAIVSQNTRLGSLFVWKLRHPPTRCSRMDRSFSSAITIAATQPKASEGEMNSSSARSWCHNRTCQPSAPISPNTLQPSNPFIIEVPSPVKADGVGVLAVVLYDALDTLLAMPPRVEQSAFARSEVTKAFMEFSIWRWIYSWFKSIVGNQGRGVHHTLKIRGTARHFFAGIEVRIQKGW